MDRDDLRARTKDFALRVIKVVTALPSSREGYVLGKQLLRSGTSIGANYREALRASTRKHFASILHTALREADETLYWLELISEANLLPPQRLSPLIKECQELVAILSATTRSIKQNDRLKKRSPTPPE